MVHGQEASPDATFDDLRHESISSCTDTLHRSVRLFNSLIVCSNSTNASFRTCSMRFDSYDTKRRSFPTVDAMSNVKGWNFMKVDEMGSVTTSGMDSPRIDPMHNEADGDHSYDLADGTVDSCV